MPSYFVKHISIAAQPGVHITEGLRDAAILALTEERDVRFQHNAKVFWIRTNQLMEFLTDACIEVSASGEQV